MYRVTKTYGHELGLSATFRQPEATSHCRFIHGYALGFKIVFEAPELDENGWVKDFGSLKPLKQRLIDTFDHKMILSRDDPHLDHLIDALSHHQGTMLADIEIVSKVGCESFAKMVYGWAQATLTPNELLRGVHVTEVECREHAGNAASYHGEV